MRQTAPHPRGDNRRKGRALRALTPHEVLHLSGHFTLRHAGANNGDDVRECRIDNRTGTANSGDLIRILDHAQCIKGERRVKGYLSQHRFQLFIPITGQCTALKAKRKNPNILRGLCNLFAQALMLFDDIIAWCLQLRLLRIAIVCHEKKPLGGYEECRGVTAKAAKIMDTLLLGDEHPVQNLLCHERTQTRDSSLNLHCIPPCGR